MHISKIMGIAGIGLVIFASGCNFGAPRIRMGSLPTPPPGPRFSNPNSLGKHSYRFNPFEQNGIVYTCKAGHIDITHVRWCADYTRYLVKKTRKTLMKKGKGFSFNLTLELSTHMITFKSKPDSMRRRGLTEVSSRLKWERYLINAVFMPQSRSNVAKP